MNDMEKPLQQAYREQAKVPLTDALTGHFTHGFFQAYLDKELERFYRSGDVFTLCFIGIDQFPQFKKANGVIEGDLAVKSVAGIIERELRQSDISARYGEDVFALLMIKTDAESAQTGVERIRKSVEKSSDGRLTVSAGLAACHGFGTEREMLTRNAWDAFRQAKLKGGNNVCISLKVKEPVPNTRQRILVVDDEPLNRKLLEALLEPYDYEVVTASDGPKALALLNKIEVDLVLLDVMMPGMDGFEVCRNLKGREDTRLIPVILVTALDDMDAKLKGIEAGADDFISKPPNKFELMARVRSLLKVKNLNNKLIRVENVLVSLANAVEAKDPYTQGHIDRVSTMSVKIAEGFGLPEYQLEALRMGSILHDIGKIAIPREVLNRYGKLDQNEWEIIQRHPIEGYMICLPLQKTLGAALDVIRHHHEKLDGSGYPDGIEGEEVTLCTRITTIVDIYDALVTDRPYRKAMSKEKALKILREEAAAGKLDKHLVKEFYNRMA